MPQRLPVMTHSSGHLSCRLQLLGMSLHHPVGGLLGLTKGMKQGFRVGQNQFPP
jgi:hypothetical protein